MPRFVLIGLLTALPAVSGCAVGPPVTDPAWQTSNVFYDNPALVPLGDHEFVWETVVDVVDDYFKIKEEVPVGMADSVPTVGQLDTFPEIGSTIFEPWRGDSVGAYEKLESTLQSIRRFAIVRVIPEQSGYLVDVAVFKELEDVIRPAHATAGAATFRNDTSMVRVVDPIGEQPIHDGWIKKGRDTALEQRIIEQIMARVGPLSAGQQCR